MSVRKNSTLARTLFIAAVFMTAAGSTLAAKLPEERFTLARAAIEEAQQVHADVSPSSELTQAESKLQEAIESNDKGRDKVAERLLAQSMLHAELAQVEGLQAQADIAFNELNAALKSLEIELGRQ